jgi:hypothetical protein
MKTTTATKAKRSVSLLLAAWLAAAAPGINLGVAAQKKDKKRQPYALLFGTVFNEDGRLVRGAQVTVKPMEGKGKWEAGSDGQGEFAVHLPAGKAVYVVEVRAPGMTPVKKEVAFEGEERQDVVLHLKRQ